MGKPKKEAAIKTEGPVKLGSMLKNIAKKGEENKPVDIGAMARKLLISPIKKPSYKKVKEKGVDKKKKSE